MQYILTEEEMKNLISKNEFESIKLIARIYGEKIIELTNFPCWGVGYCDNCPLVELERKYGLDYEYFCINKGNKRFSK